MQYCRKCTTPLLPLPRLSAPSTRRRTRNHRRSSNIHGAPRPNVDHLTHVARPEAPGMAALRHAPSRQSEPGSWSGTLSHIRPLTQKSETSADLRGPRGVLGALAIRQRPRLPLATPASVLLRRSTTCAAVQTPSRVPRGEERATPPRAAISGVPQIHRGLANQLGRSGNQKKP